MENTNFKALFEKQGTDERNWHYIKVGNPQRPEWGGRVTEWLKNSGLPDKDGTEIYEADIIELVDCAGDTIRVVCEFGTAQRVIHGNRVDITGFYFKRLYDEKKTFPIVNNYAGKHDLELFKVIGNVYDNPELLST